MNFGRQNHLNEQYGSIYILDTLDIQYPTHLKTYLHIVLGKDRNQPFFRIATSQSFFLSPLKNAWDGFVCSCQQSNCWNMNTVCFAAGLANTETNWLLLGLPTAILEVTNVHADTDTGVWGEWRLIWAACLPTSHCIQSLLLVRLLPTSNCIPNKPFNIPNIAVLIFYPNFRFWRVKFFICR